MPAMLFAADAVGWFVVVVLLKTAISAAVGATFPVQLEPVAQVVLELFQVIGAA